MLTGCELGRSVQQDLLQVLTRLLCERLLLCLTGGAGVVQAVSQQTGPLEQPVHGRGTVGQVHGVARETLRVETGATGRHKHTARLVQVALTASLQTCRRAL